MAQDSQELVKRLYAALNADPSERKAGEDALAQASNHPGFGSALGHVTLDAAQPYGIRQLAAVILKNYVRTHWQEGTRGFAPPEVGEEEKAYVRNLLPRGIADPDSKIRTAVGMAVARVAEHDWPHAWPELTPILVNLIRHRESPAHVHGALRCLSLIASDIDENQMPEVVPVLFPELQAIIAAPQTHAAGVRRRAMGVLHGALTALGLMHGAYRQQVSALLAPQLQALLVALVGVVTAPLQPSDASDVACKLEAFRCLTVVTQHFGSLVAPHMQDVLTGVWHFFSTAVVGYEAEVVYGDGEEVNEADSDGDEVNMETLLSQVVEYLLSVMGVGRWKPLLAASLPDLLMLLARYMQITQQQEEQWLDDADQFVADEEDDTVSVRVSGEMLLERIVEAYPDTSLQLVWATVLARLREGEALRRGGQAGWWRVREGALLMLGAQAEPLAAQVPPQDVRAVLDEILAIDLGEAAQSCPFLRGRALWATGKLAMSTSKSGGAAHVALCCAAAAASLAPGPHAPLTLRLSACRSLADFSAGLPADALRPLLPSAYGGLYSLLQEATEETAHVALGSVVAVVRADGPAAVAMEPTLAPALLQVWARFVTDPLISQDAVDALAAFGAYPQCLPQLVGRTLPAISSILADPASHSETLIEGALDLVVVLLKNAALEQVQAAHSAIYQQVLALGNSCEDNGVLQSVTQVLRVLVKAAGEAVLSWGPHASPQENMGLLLGVTSRLLGPTVDDSAALYVGGLLRTLLRTLPNHMNPLLSQIASALVTRLHSATVPLLKLSLLLVFACMSHLSPSGLLQCLKGLPPPEGCGEASALAFVMAQWTHWQPDVQGAYEIKLSTTGLAMLLATGDPALGQVKVQGAPIVDESQGIVTRSRAKTAGPPKFTTVSLPNKIFSLLADALLEQLEQQRGVNLDDDEWESEGDEDDAFGEELWSAGGGGHDDMLSLLLSSKNLEDAMADVDEDLDATSDPINQTDLVDYLGNYVKAFAAQDAAAFQACVQTLNTKQAEAVHKILTV